MADTTTSHNVIELFGHRKVK